MKRALKMHLISGNDLKTFLLHRTAFLCVSRFLRLASFGTVNALMKVISVTFQPLFSVIPEILCNNNSHFSSKTPACGRPKRRGLPLFLCPEVPRNSSDLPLAGITRGRRPAMTDPVLISARARPGSVSTITQRPNTNAHHSTDKHAVRISRHTFRPE